MDKWYLCGRIFWQWTSLYRFMEKRHKIYWNMPTNRRFSIWIFAKSESWTFKTQWLNRKYTGTVQFDFPSIIISNVFFSKHETTNDIQTEIIHIKEVLDVKCHIQSVLFLNCCDSNFFSVCVLLNIISIKEARRLIPHSLWGEILIFIAIIIIIVPLQKSPFRFYCTSNDNNWMNFLLYEMSW